jgi:hypothetical protein
MLATLYPTPYNGNLVMSTVQNFKSTYRSQFLDDNPALRQWCDDTVNETKRTDFFDMTPDQHLAINEWTRENYTFLDIDLTFREAVNRLGLVVVEEVIEYETDDDGSPIEDEDGKPIVKDRHKGDYSFSFVVTEEGLTDYNGKPIPKSTGQGIAFKATKQATNRPPNETNWKSLVKRMLTRWMLNGECLIKDATGTGISEQHRCWARVFASLVSPKNGDPMPPDQGVPMFGIEGIHPLAAITVDTGKSNSGKDIFGSDPELVPPALLQTPQSLNNATADGEVHYLKDRLSERVKACGVTESAAKKIRLRLMGKNINASVGDSHESTQQAYEMVKTILPDLDDLAAYCHVFAAPRIEKAVPLQPSDICAALSLYLLRGHERIDIAGNGKGIPFDEVTPIRFDLDSIRPLLAEIADAKGATANRLTEWLDGRGSSVHRGKRAPEKFAQVCRMVDAYFGGEEIDSKLLNANEIGKNSGGKYYHFGGADCGPPEKKKKGE